jgi:hypothetical protein
VKQKKPYLRRELNVVIVLAESHLSTPLNENNGTGGSGFKKYWRHTHPLRYDFTVFSFLSGYRRFAQNFNHVLSDEEGFTSYLKLQTII